MKREKTTHIVSAVSGKIMKSLWKGNQRIDSYEDFIFNYEGIPLTVQHLLDYGFVKLETRMSGCDVYQKGSWRMAIKMKPEEEKTFSLWHEKMSPPTWSLVRDIEHLHHFQNIWYDLNIEELTTITT